jgi:hypothetical protein
MIRKRLARNFNRIAGTHLPGNSSSYRLLPVEQARSAIGIELVFEKSLNLLGEFMRIARESAFGRISAFYGLVSRHRIRVTKKLLAALAVNNVALNRYNAYYQALVARSTSVRRS